MLQCPCPFGAVLVPSLLLVCSSLSPLSGDHQAVLLGFAEFCGVRVESLLNGTSEAGDGIELVAKYLFRV